MQKSLFLYPVDSESIKEENNNYIRQLISYLGKEFKIINGTTEVGVLDALLKFRKTNVYYFNWIENVPSRRFGLLQVATLVFLLIGCKIANKKVVWFVHNNISHNAQHLRTKKFVVKVMATFADLILSHSNQITLNIPRRKLHIFHHPIEEYQPVSLTQPPSYDFIVWGSVHPYKGVLEFVKHVSNNQFFNTKKILIAGKFSSDAYYLQTEAVRPDNVTIINRFIADEELKDFLSVSNYVLFTYSSPSVLSSAALCKSLSFGKEVIAPNIGSFKELGEKDLVYTYNSFEGIEELLKSLEEKKRKKINTGIMADYIQNTSWPAFSSFVQNQINSLYKR